MRGEVAQAEAHARTMVEVARQGGFLLAFPTWLATLIEVLIERDDLVAAEAELTATETNEALPESWWYCSLVFSRMRLRLAQGRPHRALEDLGSAGRILGAKLF